MIDRDQLTEALAVFDQAQPDPDDEMLAIQVAIAAMQAWLDFPTDQQVDVLFDQMPPGTSDKDARAWLQAVRRTMIGETP